MSKRNYTHVEELFPEIEAMIASGKTQRTTRYLRVFGISMS